MKWLPIAWITLQLGKALLNVPGGAFADRIGPQRALIASWWVYALAYLGFVVSPSPLVTWGLFLLYALHYGLGEGAEKALVVSLCRPARAAARSACCTRCRASCSSSLSRSTGSKRVSSPRR